MLGLQKPITVLKLDSIRIPLYSDATTFIRSWAEALFSDILPCDTPPWPRVREVMANLSKSLPDSILLAFSLQLATMARASEILSLTGADFDYIKSRVTLMQTKTGRKREANIPDTLNEAIFMLKLRPQDQLFPMLTYKRYKEVLFKKNLILVQCSKRHDKTHFLRYLPALARHCAENPVDYIRAQMGHASLNSTMHYLAALPTYLNQLERR